MAGMQALETNFGAAHFGKAPLGDVRRVRCLVRLAGRMVLRPGQSLPVQVQDQAAYQALLNLVRRPEVTHATVLQTHLDRTCALVRAHPGTVLIIHDTTELDLTSHKSLEHLGQIGTGKSQGYECHNSLAIDADTGEILGLANQILHCRPVVPKDEGVAAKRQRESRESLLWIKGCAAVHARCAAQAPAATDHLEVDVFDRGGDTFENLDAEYASERSYVCRSTHNRRIYVGHDHQATEGLLHDHVRSLPAVGRHLVELPAREAKPAHNGKPAQPAQPARQATVAVSFAAVQLRRPHVKRGKHGNAPLKVWVVRVWELAAPAGVEPLEWLLLSNVPVQTLAEAERIVGWYERRWTVEDYHKGQKTGCGIEKPQFTKEERLEPVIALLSVIAVWLLHLRWLSRQEGLKDCPAVEVVPEVYVAVLSASQGQGRRLDMTAAEFFLGLARLGGYDYPRKGRAPGWLVLWRGWGQLQSRVQYALASGRETLPTTEGVPQKEVPP
jgi:hypothetical protein